MMKIETLPLSALKPYVRNARTHSKRQIKQIAKSIERFGFNNPILIDDEKQIIAGHGRAEAAKLIGMTMVPTVRLSHLSEADKRAYILADNKLAENAGWDHEILCDRAASTRGPRFRFRDDRVRERPNRWDTRGRRREQWRVSGAGRQYALDYPQNPTTRTGDLWVLGKHRLLCADAREKASYEVLL